MEVVQEPEIDLLQPAVILQRHLKINIAFRHIQLFLPQRCALHGQLHQQQTQQLRMFPSIRVNIAKDQS